MATLPQFLSILLHSFVDDLQVLSSSDVGSSRKYDQFCSSETIQQQVSLTSQFDVLLWHGVEDHDVSLETHLSRCQHRCTNVIGLETTESDHTVTALLDGIGK